jgi:DNA-binding IclR family transcriptional regulator
MALKTLDNALELLEYFKRESTWGVRELAKEMEIHTSVAHRLVTTLEKHGYLAQDTKTKRYELGLKFLEFNSLLQEKFRFKDLIYPYMVKLAEETGESVFLTCLYGNEGLCTAIAESSHNVKFAVEVGTKQPLYAASSNLVILAYLPEDEQEKILSGQLENFTDRTMTDSDQIRAVLKRIRKQGWCRTYGEFTPEVVGIAIPLFDCNEMIIGSICVSGPLYRISEVNANRIFNLVMKERGNIQRQIVQMGLTYSQVIKKI